MKTTYCVCGRTRRDEAWEPIETGLRSYEEAEQWLRSSIPGDGEYTSFYIDREANDGAAMAYFDLRGGELILTN